MLQKEKQPASSYVLRLKGSQPAGKAVFGPAPEADAKTEAARLKRDHGIETYAEKA
jgi:hypothetical protein